MGLKRPTDIQFKSIKHILKGEDVMAVAQTGTGKTAAFAIPTVDAVIKEKKQKYAPFVQVLVMVPTRELAEQITGVFKSLTKGSTVRVAGIYGGVEQDQQINTLLKGTNIVIATPGRMFDLIAQGKLDISQVQTLVIDEADLMLDLGFAKDIKDVLYKLPKKRQTLFFTATIDKKIKSLAYDVVRNAIRIQISPKNPISKNVVHSVTFIEMDDKRFFLENLVKEHEDKKIVVFARTKVRIDRIVAAMARVDVKSEGLHGGLDQEQRFKVLERFRSNENNLLITTDLAARGIDIPSVEAVVNYDLPDVFENYVHRCGRTGRGNNVGQAISFCSDGERKLLEGIEKYIGSEIERFELSKSDYKQILDDTDDGSDDWQSLLKKSNEDDGTEDVW